MDPTDKFVPHYYRLESHLREGIRSGALRPGDPIPPAARADFTRDSRELVARLETAAPF